MLIYQRVHHAVPVDTGEPYLAGLLGAKFKGVADDLSFYKGKNLRSCQLKKKWETKWESSWVWTWKCWVNIPNEIAI